MKVVTETRNLGVRKSVKNKKMKEQSKIFSEIPKFVHRNSSLRAGAINIETFIFSEIVYKLGHFVILKTIMSKINSKTIDNLKRKKTLVKKSTIHRKKRLGHRCQTSWKVSSSSANYEYEKSSPSKQLI